METTTVEKKVFTPRNYLCSKEKYLELKGLQKKMAELGKAERKANLAFRDARRKFYHDKGMQIPVSDWTQGENGFKFDWPKVEPFDKVEARYLNIIYGILRGKSYNKIEQKTREDNEITEYKMEKYCKKFGIDYLTIRHILWPMRPDPKPAPSMGPAPKPVRIGFGAKLVKALGG